MSRKAMQIKRIYEPCAAADGVRILVDRLWPRGISRDAAHVDFWHKDIAPSADLRKWFAHDPAKWTEFKARYRAELGGNPEAVARLAELGRRGPVTLLYAAKDEQHNHAIVLSEFMQGVGKLPGSGHP